MANDFLLYGSNGFVGSVIASRAVENGLRPLLAGRNEEAVGAQAEQLGLEYRSFELGDELALAQAVSGVKAVLHCAGPYIHTFESMVEACLQQGVHYLDITGEIPVLQQLAGRDKRAKRREVMILPAVGFDVVPTDCLARHLKQRLPTANKLTLAFHSRGPGGLPPGTAKTMLEMLPAGIKVRQDGEIRPAPDAEDRIIDFGGGPRTAMRLTWGDLVTAYHSTGIPNIENYMVLAAPLARLLRAAMTVKSLFRLRLVRRLAFQVMPTGSSAQERAASRVHVWGEVSDEQGRRAVSRLHGPEGGVEWTSLAALACLQRVLAGEVRPGFQTPASVFGPDFVFAVEGVTRDDLPVLGPTTGDVP